MEMSGHFVKQDYLIGYWRYDFLERFAWEEAALNRISENVEQIEVAVALRELRSMFFH
jgi:hypothetical protein